MTSKRSVAPFMIIALLLLSTGCTGLREPDGTAEHIGTAACKGAPHYSVWEHNRRVAWMEGGDPDGFPVFYAHGNPGSRLEILAMEEKAREYGIRLIVFERPGIGRSDYREGYPLAAYARDLRRLADEMGIQDFGLIGWSSGGPPVLAAARYMPERVQFAFSLSGYTNFGEYRNARGLMEEYGLYGPALSAETPFLFQFIMSNLRRIDLFLPEYYLELSEEKMCDADRGILNNQRIAGLFSRNEQEALRPGIRGAVQDLETQWAPWEFRLEEIRVPVHVFQGKEDTFVPWKFAVHLAESIPGATLHLYDDRGHLYPLSPLYQDEIFRLASQLIRR